MSLLVGFLLWVVLMVAICVALCHCSYEPPAAPRSERSSVRPVSAGRPPFDWATSDPELIEEGDGR